LNVRHRDVFDAVDLAEIVNPYDVLVSDLPRQKELALREELARSVGTVALSGLGVMAFILVSRRYLPQAPVFRNIVLEPPADDERDELGHREALADYSALIGARGHAATDLRPAGKARINHELVDVIAEAEPLDSGTPIVVVEARGNRVVVRAVS
jgi:membrane-bound serine protease (ClpP class)